MFVSVYYGHTEIVKVLKLCGAKVEPTFKGNTVMHVVAKKGYYNIAKFLL